jgi:hypothetical protein
MSPNRLLRTGIGFPGTGIRFANRANERASFEGVLCIDAAGLPQAVLPAREFLRAFSRFSNSSTFRSMECIE